MIDMDGIVNWLSSSVLEELVDDAVLGVVFEVHRASKMGFLAVEDGSKDAGLAVDQTYPIVVEANLDVFGQAALKNKQHECICPSCNRTLAASRFAPHLEKCMGMGRNSSRIASRRIANSSKESNGNCSNGGSAFVSSILSDDDDDADWTFGGTEKKRKRKDKHSKKKSTKVKNGGAVAAIADTGNGVSYNVMDPTVGTAEQPAGPVSNGLLTYDSLGLNQKKTLLLQMCGVVSEHTGKLCTRSLRCPQHSDEQKRNIRLALLGPQYEQDQLLSTYLKSEPADSDHTGTVDVDSYEDGDSQAVREALTRGSNWEQVAELSGTSSPADSTSTTSSSSKKPTTPKNGKKGGKKGSKNNTPPNSIAGNDELYSH